MNDLEKLKKIYTPDYQCHVNVREHSFFVEVCDDGGGVCVPRLRRPISFPSAYEFLVFLRYTELPRMIGYMSDDCSSDFLEKANFLDRFLEAMLKGEMEFHGELVEIAVNKIFGSVDPAVTYIIHGDLKNVLLKSDIIDRVMRVSFMEDMVLSFSSESHGFQSLLATYQRKIPEFKLLLGQIDLNSDKVRRVLSSWFEEQYYS